MSTTNLFGDLLETQLSEPILLNTVEEAKIDFQIPGLTYVKDFITPEEHCKIMTKVDNAEWSTALSRRVQHYGYRYDYKSRRIDASMEVGPLPKWLRYLGNRLVQQGSFETTPDQVIVNEYLPGQGISPHVDCEPCFGDTVVSLSLNSGCIMDFSHVKDDRKTSIWLEPLSIVVIKGEARRLWKHSIAKRHQDVHDGRVIQRQRRVSLTFRTVIL